MKILHCYWLVLVTYLLCLGNRDTLSLREPVIITNPKNKENKDFIEILFFERQCEKRSFSTKTTFLIFEN